MDEVCPIIDARLRAIEEKHRGETQGSLFAKLPLIDLPAEPRGPLLAIILSGDGGWRDLDKTIGEKPQSEGVSVVGWDCLSYFWSRKSPEQLARDLDAVIDAFVSR